MSFMFNHWFEDDIDCKRENEVHKPILNTNYVSEANGYEVQAVCRICKKGVSNCAFYANTTKEQAIKSFNKFENTFNYCPYCGARLKAE